VTSDRTLEGAGYNSRFAAYRGPKGRGWLLLAGSRSPVSDAEVPDEGDRVALGIADGGELHALVHRLDRSGRQPPSRDVGDVLVQVVDREVQQGPAGAIGVASDLDPSTVGHPPFDEPTLHRQVVGQAAKQTLVPSVRSFEVGHRDYGEDMIDGHRLLPLSSERTDGRETRAGHQPRRPQLPTDPSSRVDRARASDRSVAARATAEQLDSIFLPLHEPRRRVQQALEVTREPIL
jgi:hypothetical protein